MTNNLSNGITERLFYTIGKRPDSATKRDLYMALSYAVRDHMMSYYLTDSKPQKEVSYLSAEFLICPQFANNLLNLVLQKDVEEALYEYGYSLDDLFDMEGFDNLKLRVSLGQTGNEPLGSYLSLQRFAPAGSFYYNGAYVSNFKSEPKILITKSDGSYLYLTTDLATVINRLEKNDFDKTLYVVDKRQKLHFEQLFDSLDYFEFEKREYEHISFGTINDANGNAATLTLASPGASGSLGANKALVIDGVVPTVTNVTSTTVSYTHLRAQETVLELE